MSFIFVGPQGARSKYGAPNKGVMRARRAQKRLEAEARQQVYRMLTLSDPALQTPAE